jgi:hypothetical protein
MESFLQFINKIENTHSETLEEALITLGGKAYPRFGNIAIMAGGAGSGKGFVKDKLLGLEGSVFDVDELKLLATRIPSIITKVKREMGIDLTKFDVKKDEFALKDPEKVSQLHDVIGNFLQLDRAKFRNITRSVFEAPRDRKPNLIFDVTMKDMKQFNKYTKPFQELGYDKKNIHLIWVINDVKIAKEQNEQRARTVPVDILFQTHAGAALTVREVVKMGNEVRDYLDGDIVFAFNKVKVDSTLAKSEIKGVPDYSINIKKPEKDKKVGGSYVGEATYVYIKRAGKSIDERKLTDEILTKISYYVPDEMYSRDGKATIINHIQGAWSPK